MKSLLILALGLPLMILAAFSNPGDYTLVNKTGVNVTNISISPAGENNWNILASSVSKDQNVDLTYNLKSDVCAYDVRFTDEKGNEHLMQNVELCNNNSIALGINEQIELPQVKLQPAVK